VTQRALRPMSRAGQVGSGQSDAPSWGKPSWGKLSKSPALPAALHVLGWLPAAINAPFVALRPHSCLFLQEQGCGEVKVLLVFKTTKKEAVSSWLHDLSLLFFFFLFSFYLFKKEQIISTFSSNDFWCHRSVRFLQGENS